MLDAMSAGELRDALADRVADRHRALGLAVPAEVDRALRTVPRHLFTGDVAVEAAYEDTAIITKRDERGISVSSVSAPWLQAMMLGQAGLKPGDRVLEVGSGGWLPVVVNNLGFVRGGDWVLPCQPCAGGPVSDVSVRYTAAVRMVAQEARAPVVFGDPVAKLAAGFPLVPVPVIEGMVTELVRRRILLTSLRPPMTVTDPLAHIAARLGQPEAPPAGISPGSRVSVDLRLDWDRITGAYRGLPVATEGAMAVQVSSPSLSARADGLARVPQVLPLLPLGEHRQPSQAAVDVDDLAVTADARRRSWSGCRAGGRSSR
jgi:hypothetical protein